MASDFWIVFQWWGVLFLVGAVAFALTKRLFAGWWDEGYLFSKAVGMAVVTWIVYATGMLHLLPFTPMTISIALFLVFIGGIALSVCRLTGRLKTDNWCRSSLLILVEEIFFFAALLFWSWVKAHEPSIHGLEKFMDYGFMQSILNSRFFPPTDTWYAGSSINYYYFGHMVVAVLTKLSGLDLAYTFNLMLATIFALTLTMSFSIGIEISRKGKIGRIGQVAAGVLTSFLVTLAGNMQTIYAFTRGYTGDNVKPFWQLLWPIGEFWQKLPEGMRTYWYANATRFIPFTIHEFPSYSFVVSDIHGHVLSLPFVFLAIALLKMMSSLRFVMTRIVFYGFLVGVLLMTNALDGPIYLMLFLVLLVTANLKWKSLTLTSFLVIGIASLTSVPFLVHFKSFVNGLAINCPPAFLANSRFGLLIFEGVEKCQHSPLWMMALLWGFFLYCGVWLLLKKKFTQIEKLLLVFFGFSVFLIIFPEFFYFKDIYPAHFRSNTMFKLGYQAFILFSIVAGYAITHALFRRSRIFLILLIPQLFLVSIYPYFSVRSYFGELREYKGFNGLEWLAREYPDDWAGIEWLNSQMRSPTSLKLRGATSAALPTLVEADGDSYTDSARFSAFTGIPTIIGWPVHEWLWRGSYDVVAPRREEVRKIYESADVNEVRQILTKYNVRYIVVGTLERQKYQQLHEEKFRELGSEVFRSGQTTIYKLNNQ